MSSELIKGEKSFSSTNLKYMRDFYEMYPDVGNRQHSVDDLGIQDNVKAGYALEASSQPMGISEYDFNTFLPEEYKGSMPTIEEIEAELSDSEGGRDG